MKVYQIVAKILLQLFQPFRCKKILLKVCYNKTTMEESSPLELKEQIEKASEFENGWSRYLALTTAIIAVLSALASLQSATFSDKALLMKNDAVLFQNQASDQWNYYQAKGVKKNIADSFAIQSGRINFKQQAEQYGKEQEDIKKQATDLESKVKDANEASSLLFEKHHRTALGVTFLQIAVALSAMGALLRRKSLWYLSITSAIVGIVLVIIGVFA